MKEQDEQEATPRLPQRIELVIKKVGNGYIILRYGISQEEKVFVNLDAALEEIKNYFTN